MSWWTLKPRRIAYAHCDLPCGVYDPAQARIEAQSVVGACEKYAGTDDPVFKERCVVVKDDRAEEVKHHLAVLWTDFFKPHHLEAHPELHELFWRAGKAAGEAKKTMDGANAQELVSLIDEIADIFWQTDESKGAGLYPRV